MGEDAALQVCQDFLCKITAQVNGPSAPKQVPYVPPAKNNGRAREAQKARGFHSEKGPPTSRLFLV